MNESKLIRDIRELEPTELEKIIKEIEENRWGLESLSNNAPETMRGLVRLYSDEIRKKLPPLINNVIVMGEYIHELNAANRDYVHEDLRKGVERFSDEYYANSVNLLSDTHYKKINLFGKMFGLKEKEIGTMLSLTWKGTYSNHYNLCFEFGNDSFFKNINFKFRKLEGFPQDLNIFMEISGRTAEEFTEKYIQFIQQDRRMIIVPLPYLLKKIPETVSSTYDAFFKESRDLHENDKSAVLEKVERLKSLPLVRGL